MLCIFLQLHTLGHFVQFRESGTLSLPSICNFSNFAPQNGPILPLNVKIFQNLAKFGLT